MVQRTGEAAPGVKYVHRKLRRPTELFVVVRYYRGHWVTYNGSRGKYASAWGPRDSKFSENDLLRHQANSTYPTYDGRALLFQVLRERRKQAVWHTHAGMRKSIFGNKVYFWPYAIVLELRRRMHSKIRGREIPSSPSVGLEEK